MPPSSPTDKAPIRPPHPLALRLIERLRPRLPGRVRVLDFAAGSGRNTAALADAGFDVVAIDDATAAAMPIAGLHGQFAGMVSTHGFLHGSAADVARRIDAVARHLSPEAPIAVTFGSPSDTRVRAATRIDESTYAPQSGEERGVAHAFFTESQLLALLAPAFDVESVEERGADGKAESVHWFVLARRR
ncbi:MAG: hypothetical protein JO277_12680 [Candidatus Eremiobacteraeota bacterium]|nr:hypothetical protein [Candidatus Eremiobacteraeota bacterium]